MQLDELDKRLLDAMQSEFPLQERPYLALGEALGTTEEDILSRVRALKEAGVIRQTSAIFASTRLGYESVLLAHEIPLDKIEEAAERINQHPGVSHNYERSHVFSLWCTLTVPPECDLRQHAEALARVAGSTRYLFLPSTRLFKIGVRFPMSKDGKSAAPKAAVRKPDAAPAAPLDAAQRQAACALQGDLAVEPEPFRKPAEAAGVSAKELLDQARRFIADGAMRRYAAILRHRQAGFTHNVMSVWNVPEDQAEEAGIAMTVCSAVSHCYQRPTAPGWPYSHFAMIHGRSDAENAASVAEIEASTGITDHRLLRTVREFKKIRVVYFTPEIAEWERANGVG